MGYQSAIKQIESDPQGFEEYVKELLEFKHLDGGDDMVVGIAKLITTQGVGALTERQLNAFVKVGLLPYLYISECDLCTEEIPWNEMYQATGVGGTERHAYCEHQLEKNQ